MGLCTLLTAGEDMSDERSTAGLIGDRDAMSDLSGKIKKYAGCQNLESFMIVKPDAESELFHVK